MNKFLFTNNARGTSKFAVNPGDLNLTLNAGQGALFPNPGIGECFRTALIDSLGNIEIIECTARAGDVFTTIQRGMEGTIPIALAANDRISLRVTKEIFEYLRDDGGHRTGDYRLTLRTVSGNNWLMCNDGTIGSAASGADHANADAQNLYTLLWTNVLDAWAPVSGGRGVSAVADWGANKKIALTKVLGRALCIAGGGSGLTARALGQILGEELHVLLTAELAIHNHGGATGGQSAGHTHSYNDTTILGATPNGGGGTGVAANAGTTGPVSNDHNHSIANDGSGTGHNNMQPSAFANVEIHL